MGLDPLPLVSVIIPAYNTAAFISKTLDSVLSQTYRNLEVLVVDDGSQDETPEIVKLIAQSDRRVTLLRQSNAGVAAARNLAIQKSSGEYIAPIDADDIWYPQKIEKQVQCMLKTDACVGLVYAWAVYIDPKDLIIGKYNPYEFFNIYNLEGDVYTALVYRNFVGNASVPLIRRACLDKVGGYNCKLKKDGAQGCEDLDLYLRIAEYYQFKVVPEFLLGYRQLNASMSGNCMTMAKSYNTVMADVQQRHPEIPNAIYQWSASQFYSYLLGKSYACGDYLSSLLCLKKAVQLDFAFLLRPGMYKVFVISILQIAAKSLTLLNKQDAHSWLQFKQKVKFDEPVITICDVNKQINKPQQLPWKPYDRLLLQRWLRVVQISHTISP